MSVKVMGLVWDLEMEPNEKLVLLAYADHASHDGTGIWPAVATIMKKTGYSERSVQAITRSLEEKGLLVEDGSGPKGTNKWRVGGAIFAPADSAGVQPTAPGGAENAPVGVQPTAPEPSLTIKEPSEKKEEEENIFRVYESEIAPLTPHIADELDEAEKVHTAQWVNAALRVASANGKRNWAYVKAILGRWKAEGYGTERATTGGNWKPRDLKQERYGGIVKWLAKEEAGNGNETGSGKDTGKVGGGFPKLEAG
jgi:DnaD/phage-associated family protein